MLQDACDSVKLRWTRSNASATDAAPDDDDDDDDDYDDGDDEYFIPCVFYIH